MSKKQVSKQKNSKKDKQQKQQQQEVPKYKCPNGKPALFLCKSSKCKNYAIKCIQTNSCNTCKKNHQTCSHEIRISEMLKIAEILQKKAPITQYKQRQKDEDLIQRMEKELAQIKKKYLNMSRQKWGITSEEAEFIFQKKVEGQKSVTLYQISKQKTIYPDTRFYLPPQFRHEADKLYEEIKKFNRVFKLHDIYKQLASIDCKIKFLQQNKNKINIKALDKIHKQFKTIIEERIKYNNEEEAEKEPLDKEKEDFKYIADRIFNLIFDEVKKAFNQNKFKQVLEMIELIFDLFRQSRKWFALDRGLFSEELKKLQSLKGISNYQMGYYQQSYLYYSALEPSSLTKQQLEKLVALTQILNKSPQQKLKYLHLLESKQNKNKETFVKILACYEALNDEDKIYAYMKKIIEIQLDQSKYWINSSTEHERQNHYKYFSTFLKRYQFCVRYEEKRREILIMLRTIGEALGKIDERKENINQEHMLIGLWLRYRMVLYHRQSYVNYYQSADTANKKCEQYLKIINKWKDQRQIDEAKKQKISKQIKQFHYKFLLLEAQGRKDKNWQFDLYQRAKIICDQLKLKIFEPVYQMARLSFDLQRQDAQLWQEEALKIYPTSTCYRNKSILLYQEYVSGRGIDPSLLRRSINCIDKSLSLDPTQAFLYHLRGTVHQNLGKFQQSNADFQKVIIDNQRTQFDINRRTAENNQFIVKAAPAHPQRQQLLEKALNLYDICLNDQPNNERCIFGRARVLKLLRKFTLAEQQFNRLKDNTQYKVQIKMYLGNIKEQLATMDGDRDFGLLEEALKLYKQAGQIRENYDNLIRIYKQLDEETEAEKLEQKFRPLR